MVEAIRYVWSNPGPVVVDGVTIATTRTRRACLNCDRRRAVRPDSWYRVGQGRVHAVGPCRYCGDLQGTPAIEVTA